MVCDALFIVGIDVFVVLSAVIAVSVDDCVRSCWCCCCRCRLLYVLVVGWCCALVLRMPLLLILCGIVDVWVLLLLLCCAADVVF